MAYDSSFAAIYDEIISNQVDFDDYCGFALQLCEKYGIKLEKVLDIGCGSGLFSLPLLQSGLDVTGIDLSEDMLSLAQKRLPENAELICQNMCKFMLYEQFDAAFCTLDGLNHLTHKKDFEAAVKHISMHIKNDGAFFFDVNTVYKHKNVLANNTFIFDEPDFYLVWQNFCKDTRVDMQMDCFVRKNDKFKRFCDDISERAYDDDYILSVLCKFGFKILCKKDFHSFGRICKKSEKIIYLAKKVR